MAKIIFTEEEIAWIMYQLGEFAFLNEKIAEVLRFLTNRWPKRSTYEVPDIPTKPPLEEDKA